MNELRTRPSTRGTVCAKHVVEREVRDGNTRMLIESFFCCHDDSRFRDTAKRSSGQRRHPFLFLPLFRVIIKANAF